MYSDLSLLLVNGGYVVAFGINGQAEISDYIIYNLCKLLMSVGTFGSVNKFMIL